MVLIIIEKALLSAVGAMNKANNFCVNVSKYLFYGWMIIIAINLEIFNNYFDKYMESLYLVIPIILFLAMAVNILDKIIESIYFYVHTLAKKTASIIAVHEAGHALIGELIFPKVNKYTLIRKGIFGCWKGFEYKCPGINMMDEFRVKLYIESNKCTVKELFTNLLFIRIAGFVAENLDLNYKDLEIQFYRLVDEFKNIHDSDYYIAVWMAQKIADSSERNEKDILFDALAIIKDTLIQHQQLLLEIKNLLIKKKKINGKHISKIVKNYYKNHEYGYTKVSKMIFIKLVIVTLICKTGAGRLIIYTLKDFKIMLKETKKEFLQLLKESNQIR